MSLQNNTFWHYLEFISMVKILWELEPLNMLLFQTEGSRVLKKKQQDLHVAIV